MIDYQIIASGSTGNATVINGNILIDCGVSLKALRPYPILNATRSGCIAAPRGVTDDRDDV